MEKNDDDLKSKLNNPKKVDGGKYDPNWNCPEFVVEKDQYRFIDDLKQEWETYSRRARSGTPSKNFWPATCF